MDLIFASVAGLLTLLNPCVLPVLPIVVASSLQIDPRAPLALALGMGLSFVALGTGVAALTMAGFGAVLARPAPGRRFAAATA